MHLIGLLNIFLLIAFCESMTMKQIQNTGKMMRKSCQPKFNVVNAQVDPIITGVFDEDPEVKCYIACIMKMANMMKNGKVNYEATLTQADVILPPDIKEQSKEAVTACKKHMNNKDVCEAAFHTTKCIYNHNPGIFYFP